MFDALDILCETLGVDPGKAVIGAGAAMYLHGLRKEVNDIDFYHEDLVGTPHRKAHVNGWEFDFGGKAWPPEMKEFVVIGGRRVQSKKALLSFYRVLNREKDQNSIKLLEGSIGEP